MSVDRLLTRQITALVFVYSHPQVAYCYEHAEF